MRGLLVALVLAGLCMAFSVQPSYIGVQDTGNKNLPAMDVGITIDCDTKTLTVTAASNETGKPIGKVKVFLFYTNYAYQAIANGQTGDDGVATLGVVGTRDYLTSMFILHAEQTQFRTREIEFTYEKCFQQPPAPHPVTNATNQTNSTTNVTLPQNETPPANLTPPGNATPPRNGTSGQPPAVPPRPAPALPCLPSLLLVPLGLLSSRRYA